MGCLLGCLPANVDIFSCLAELFDPRGLLPLVLPSFLGHAKG